VDVPSPWEFALLALAAWRVWHLIAEDDLTAGLRDRLAPAGTKRRDWIECPYCSGAWVAGAWWLAWTWHHSGTTWFASLWAVAAAVVAGAIVVNRVTD
jgi:hypothetical protein